MEDVFWAGSWGAVVAVLLRAFYSHISVSWPERYMDPEDVVARYVSSEWWRYALFRSVPVVLAAILVVHGAGQIGVRSDVSAGSFAVAHVLIGPLVAALRVPQGVWGRRRILEIHLMSTVIVALSTVAVWVTRGRAAWLAPRLEDISTNIWSTLIAIALAKFFYDRLGERPVDSSPADVAFSRVRPEKLDVLRGVECGHGDAMVTIAMAEAVNRPLWFRRIEQILPGVRTRGLMQVRSSRPLTDEESVRRYTDDHRAWCQSAGGDISFEECVGRHNADPKFLEMCRVMRSRAQAAPF